MGCVFVPPCSLVSWQPFQPLSTQPLLLPNQLPFPGMIAWNVIAALSSFASLLTWIVQYFVKLRENVLIREDRTEGRWTTSGKANIGHSFWLVVVAFAIFCLNVTILHFLRKRRNKSQNSKRAIVEATTKPNGNLMLY